MDEVAIVADFTKCYPNRLTAAEIALKRAIEDWETDENNVHLVALSWQASSVRRSFPRASYLESTEENAQTTLENCIRSLRSELADTDKSLVVVTISYNGFTLRKAKLLKAPPSFIVETTTFNEFIKPTRDDLASRTESTPLASKGHDRTPRLEWPAPLDETLRLLVRVLHKRDRTSQSRPCRKADVRPWMAAEDKRFEGRGTRTDTQGMMSQIVDTAEKRGLIGVDPDEGTVRNDYLWLNMDSTELKQMLSIPSSSTQQAEATHNVSSNDSSFQGQSDPGAPVLALDEKQQAEIMKPTRADTMHKALVERRRGPFASVRRAMFDTLKGLVPEVHLPATELFSRCKDDARKALESPEAASAPTDGKRKHQPWRMIEEFYRRLFVDARVLLDERDQPVKPGVEGILTPVHSLAEGWEVAVDAENLVALFEVLDDVQADELQDIAGVLYHDRSPELVGHVGKAIQRLVQDRRVVEYSANGALCLKLADPENNDKQEAHGMTGTAPAVPPDLALNTKEADEGRTGQSVGQVDTNELADESPPKPLE